MNALRLERPIEARRLVPQAGRYSNPLNEYVSSACRHPMLTKTEEASRFQEIQSGREALAQLVLSLPAEVRGPLPALDEVVHKGGPVAFTTREVERACRERLADSTVTLPTEVRDQACRIGARIDHARDELVLGNLRLVMSIARQVSSAHVSLPDRFQEGIFGLIEAIERFDPARGFRLSTYAGWWIRRAVHLALGEQSDTVRTSRYLRSQVASLDRAWWDLTARLGRPATARELSEQTGVEEGRVGQIRRLTPQIVALDAPDDGQPARAVRRAMATTAPGPLDQLLSATELNRLVPAVDRLEERERVVIRMRFGLNQDGCARTLAEIGRRLHLSRERVRQIESVALGRLREYLEGALGRDPSRVR